jgi:ribonucleoside-diphosphate reductase alpha chain
MDLHWIDHVVAQSVWQNWIDNSISKTINMPYNVTVDDVKNAYILAHELGLKGIALFRDGSRNEQVLHVGSNVQSNKNEQNVQKDTPGTAILPQAPSKNQVERKVPPSRFAMNYIRDRVNEQLMVELTIHAGKSATFFEKGDECPSCKKLSLVSEGGCNSCKSCGYATCSVA